MKRNAWVSRSLIGLSMAFGASAAWPQVDSCEIRESDRYDNCAKALSDAGRSGANEQYQGECRQAATERRAELDEWGVDSAAMSDAAIFDRYDRELVARCKADREQTRRDSLEHDRLAAERATAEADRARIAAERNRQAEEYGAQQMNSGQAMMKEQNEMLRGLGVNLGDISLDSEEDLEDDDYSAAELQMYERMIDSGAAPGCKGTSGAAMVECVDAALDAEDE